MKKLIALMILSIPLSSFAFESGSTGADGELNIIEDTELQLPPSGIFNFTNVTVETGATLTFAKNANNSPITILATGDISIRGIINLDGIAGVNVVSPPVPENGLPGNGGPGGFNGGKGGIYHFTGSNGAEDGKGPGHGGGAITSTDPLGRGVGGGGAGFSGIGAPGVVGSGPIYGNSELLPLIGGSGGGGGSGGNTSFGAGGGGGAGAILIAASGTIDIFGGITANGGQGGNTAVSTSWGGGGGGGSGGAIRIVATTIQGEGTIIATGGSGGTALRPGGNGANGRIRLEAENFLRLTNTSPSFTFSAPNPVFISNLPSIAITSIGGEIVPNNPSGFRDVELPGITTNPVTVQFSTTNIPLGTILTTSAAQERKTVSTVSVNTTPVAGSLTAGTASAEINLPNGNSTLFAQTTFTVTASLGQDFSKYAQGEQVEKVRISVNTQGESSTIFITVSGKEFTWPSYTVAMN